MFNLFKKKSKDFSVIAPVSGTLIKLEDVSDPVFSEKMMGDGFAIVPDAGEIISPVSGTIVSLPDSKHAIGIKTESGVEILIHIGLDTVNLNGEGFTALVKEGEKIEQGTKLLDADLDFMKDKGIDTKVMTIFTAGYDKEISPVKEYGSKVEKGEFLLK